MLGFPIRLARFAAFVCVFSGFASSHAFARDKSPERIAQGTPFLFGGGPVGAYTLAGGFALGVELHFGIEARGKPPKDRDDPAMAMRYELNLALGDETAKRGKAWPEAGGSVILRIDGTKINNSMEIGVRMAVTTVNGKPTPAIGLQCALISVSFGPRRAYEVTLWHAASMTAIDRATPMLATGLRLTHVFR